jgi:hypothetical protein
MIDSREEFCIDDFLYILVQRALCVCYLLPRMTRSLDMRQFEALTVSKFSGLPDGMWQITTVLRTKESRRRKELRRPSRRARTVSFPRGAGETGSYDTGQDAHAEESEDTHDCLLDLLNLFYKRNEKGMLDSRVGCRVSNNKPHVCKNKDGGANVIATSPRPIDMRVYRQPSSLGKSQAGQIFLESRKSLLFPSSCLTMSKGFLATGLFSPKSTLSHHDAQQRL